MQSIENNVSKPLVLMPKQRDVLDALKSIETKKYCLSDWYLGALHALDSHHNPDRISQAAHSLRELIEKLPRVVHESDVKAKKFGLPDQQLNRREQVQQALASIDPMANQLGSEIQESKRDQLFDLWKSLEGFAHHKSNPEIAEFIKGVKELETIVFDLLAPITAQDQEEIQTILNSSTRSDDDVERVFWLIQRRGANFVFFIKQISEKADTTWLPILQKKGYFANPPSVQIIDDGTRIYPFWWPMRYLTKISNQVPNEVLEIVTQLPEVDNPRIYEELLDIALQLREEQSAELKSKMLEYAHMEQQFLTHRFANLLAHWAAENQTSAALELSKVLVAFLPDPQSEEKQKRRKENPMTCGPLLNPSPRMELWDYREIMSEGIEALAEKKPYEVACLLIHVTANMLRLRTHPDEFDKEKYYSDILYTRLRESNSDYENSEKTLVHTLTFACEKVFEGPPDAIVDLDNLLRKQKWNISKRLRHHLYAKYPNEKTKPWIRELILAYKDYHQWQYRYEFQQMIRSACEHFKEELLTLEERTQVFESIRSGPQKGDCTEEDFQKRQRDFHRMQFSPFAPVLFGEYKTYFLQLESNMNDQISDEDYPPFKSKSGWVSKRSPRTSEDLAKLKDEELLTYINEWDQKDEIYEDDNFVEIDIEALADEFQTVFRESIIPDANRLKFWMENREQIKQPIYVRMIICAMEAHVKVKNFDNLNEWLTFSEWVLSHIDRECEGDHNGIGESHENSDWNSTRRAVCDFIGICLIEDVNVPVSVRRQMAKLLEMLCTQLDECLDQNVTTKNPVFDSYTAGINSTRGRSLESLVKFGFWLRRHDSECEVTEVRTILEKRFNQETVYPLTLPEYAVLGRNYCYIANIDEMWATEHKTDFFPQKELPTWFAAFSSFIDYSGSFKITFKILHDDFIFALQNLSKLKKRNCLGQETIDILGQHLFDYYLRGMFPLKGEESLLEQYYQKTINNREHWANLFNYIGHRLSNNGKHLDQKLKDRIIDFFEWRFIQKEKTELRQFTYWFESKCLDAEWRLKVFSDILEICRVERARVLRTLCDMLPEHTKKVVECFAKLTEDTKDPSIYIRKEDAKIILDAGRESSEESVRRFSEQAKDNLLKSGRFVLLDLED